MATQTIAAHPAVSRLTINRVGLWLFFFSETFLFGALLAARFYLTQLDRPEHLNQALGLGITSILLLSSLTAYRAETAIAHGDRRQFVRNLVATIVLGIVFVVGVGLEWSIAEFTPKDIFGSAFFTMTGMHASHVISGIALLGLVLWLGLHGHFSRDSHWGVEAAVKYWHFVDVVWVFFYPALYLVSW